MAKVSAEKLTFEFIDHIISAIGLKADIEVEEEKDIIKVKISGDNLGALIGFHGETLESLQLIASLMLNRSFKDEEWKRVVIDIGNWRVEHTNTLISMVERAVKEITEQNLEKVSLPSMSASQRREIHVIVTEKFPDFATESEGQEPNRGIILFKKP